ncbi:MAG: hypothetical protein RLZZ215_841 [Pseudomonadota bacterium]|jgi:putative transcriptional regulator
MNINKIAAAIEIDAGEPIPDLKASLAEMEAGVVGRIYTPEQLLITEVRQTLQLTQPRFATLIDTPLATLRDWEQGRFKPAGAVLCLLRLLRKRPEIAQELEHAN